MRLRCLWRTARPPGGPEGPVALSRKGRRLPSLASRRRADAGPFGIVMEGEAERLRKTGQVQRPAKRRRRVNEATDAQNPLPAEWLAAVAGQLEPGEQPVEWFEPDLDVSLR